MSSRRSRSGQLPSNISRWITEQQQITEHLLALLPQSAAVIGAGSDRAESAAKVLQTICDYIRELHREVDGLSERLSELLVVLNDSGRHQPP